MKKSQIDLIKEEAKKAEERIKPVKIRYKTYNAKTKRFETKERVLKSGKEANSFRRIIIIGLFILAEFGFLIFLYTQLILGFLWFLFIPYGLGIIFACRVAVSSKNHDSKIAWILFLLILAPVGVVVYLFAGEMTNTPLKSWKLERVHRKTKFLKKVKIPKDLSSRVRQECRYIQNTSDFTPFFNGTAEYFSEGERFFDDVLEELKKAEKFIFMDFYIVKDGLLAKAIFEILMKKAHEGVDVRIIVDGLGSHDSLGFFKVRKLRKHGIKLRAFEPVIPIINFFMNYRNHRKIIIIDGKTGYTGGTNISDEYINAKKKFGIWKDASIKINGGAVKNLILMFLRMWEYSSREKPDYEAFLNLNEEDNISGENVLVPYGDGPSEKHKLGKGVYGNIISNAQKYLYIMTPYFIIDDYLIDLLKTKSLGGVDVRIIIPGIPDKKFVYALTYANAEKLISSGIKIYTYTPGFLHSKVMLSDGECAVVGSINMDFRSFYQQYECAVYIAESEALKDIENDFDETFAASQEITEIRKRNIFRRIVLGFIRLFAPLM